MTEPVGYGVVVNNRLVEVRFFDKPNPEEDWDLTPLYTAEQLQPRVKMTQAQFDEFNKFFRYRKDTTIGNMLSFILNRRDNETTNLYKRFYETGTLEGSIKAQAEFSSLWLKFYPDKPEETIEIVHDMKWFVMRKLPNTGGNMLKCSEDGLLTYNAVKEAATQFNTKEEAEEWTNPLTEAVQLPVEGD